MRLKSFRSRTSVIGKATALKMSALLIVVLALSFVALADSAPADAAGSVTILPPGASWEYTFVDPTSDVSWNTTTGSWTTGSAPFGTPPGTNPNPDFYPGTVWEADTADQIVNIDARRAEGLGGTFTTITVPPGTYELTVIGIADGGAYDAWSAWTQFAGPWVSQYAYTTPTTGSINVGSTAVIDRYATPAIALANAPATQLVEMPNGGDIDFWNSDSILSWSDNGGGMSIRVSKVDGDDLWVRTEVDLSTIDLSTVEWNLGVDNGFKLYVNGTLIASDNQGGGTFRWEYPNTLVNGDMGPALVHGTNVIAVALQDQGGATGFDMQITGDPAPVVLGRTPWEMLGNNPLVNNVPNYGTHGDPRYYDHIGPVPTVGDSGWGPAPNGSTIGFGGPSASRLGGIYGCLTSLDYTFFQTLVDIPVGTTLTGFSIEFSGMDDGSRITVFNSAYPTGLVIPGSYVFLNATGTTDLASFMQIGEVNRVVITQIDDCATGNNLQTANIVLNGSVISPNNAPAIGSVSVTSPIDENDTAVLTVVFSDDSGDTHDAVVNWGEGSPEAFTGVTSPFTPTHQYLDDNPSGTSSDAYTISVTITDDLGESDNGSTSVTVNNVDPTADAGGPYEVLDGGSIVLSGSGSDVAGINDPLSFSWDLDDDGLFETSGANPTFDSSGFVGAGPHVVTLRVDDGDLGVTTDSTTVTINQPPVVEVDGATTVYYVDWLTANPSAGTASGVINLPNGDTIGVEFEAVDPSGNPSPYLGAQTNGGTNYWAASAPYISAEVPNAPPDSDILRLSGGDNTTYIVTFTEPIVGPIMPILSLGQPSLPTTYDFDSPFTIVSQGAGHFGGCSTCLSVLPGDVLRGDEGHGTIIFDGTFSTFSWTVPTNEVWHGFTFAVRTSASLENTVVVDEGQTAVNLGTWSDPDGDAVTLALTGAGVLTQNGDGTWDWSFDSTDGPNESQALTITATDEHGLTGTTSFGLVVVNVDPTIVDLAGSDVNESDSVTITGTIVDPGVADTFTVVIDWGGSEGTSAATVTGNSFTASHQYLDDDPTGTSSDLYNVTATVTDDDFGVGSASIGITITNVAPVIESLIGDDDAGSVSVVFSDVGILDTHVVSIDWGDGSSELVTPISGTASEAHLFPQFGTYTVTVTVTDDDGGSAINSVELVIGGGACLCTKGKGWWEHEFDAEELAEGATKLTPDQIDLLIRMIGAQSAVFSGLTLQQAQNTFDPPKSNNRGGNGNDSKSGRNDASATASSGSSSKKRNQIGSNAASGSKPNPLMADLSKFEEQALAHTLAAWANYAKGAVDWNELIDVDGTPMTFGDLITEVESLLMGVDPTKADLERAKDLAEAVNQHDKNNPDCDTGSGDSESGSGSESNSGSDAV